MTLQDLLDWPPEIGELAGATRDAAANHFTSAEFYRALTTAARALVDAR